MRLTVVIPAYNEAHRIGDTLLHIRRYLSAQPYDAEVLIVDDGSTDGTVEAADAIRWPAAVVHRLRENRGKGYAVCCGVRLARGEYVLFCDADNATPFEQIERFWPVLERAQVAIGSRHLEGSDIVLRQPWARRVGARVGNLLVRTLVVRGFSDTQCGFKMFRRDAALPLFERQTIWRWGFDIEILYLAHRLGLAVAQVPVDWYDRRGSKVQSWRTFATTFLELLTIRWRAMTGVYEVAPGAGPRAWPPGLDIVTESEAAAGSDAAATPETRRTPAR